MNLGPDYLQNCECCPLKHVRDSAKSMAAFREFCPSALNGTSWCMNRLDLYTSVHVKQSISVPGEKRERRTSREPSDQWEGKYVDLTPVSTHPCPSWVRFFCASDQTFDDVLCTMFHSENCIKHMVLGLTTAAQVMLTLAPLGRVHSPLTCQYTVFSSSCP